MRADPTCEPHLSPTHLGSWSDPAKPWTCFQQSACRVQDWEQSARELLLSPTIKEPTKCPAKALSVLFLKVQKSHSPAKVGYRQGLFLGRGGLRNRTPHACGSSPSPNTSSGQPDRAGPDVSTPILQDPYDVRPKKNDSGLRRIGAISQSPHIGQ